MNEDFRDALSRRLTARQPVRLEPGPDRAAAVLVPIVASEEPTLILTVRTDTLPSHKGQISFPGGSLDPGEDARAAALREAREEIGLDPAAVSVLGELDTVRTYVSGYLVTPVVGWLDEPPSLQPNPAEVAAVLQVPIRDLADDIRFEAGFAHSGKSFPTGGWLWNDNVIWGLTARLLYMFLEELAAAGLGPAPGRTPWPLPPEEDAPPVERAG